MLYRLARPSIQSGDVIAFDGWHWVSRIIAWFVGFPTHIGVVKRINSNGRVLVQESTSLNGVGGVVERPLSDIVRTYNGEVYHIPLSSHAREQLDIKRFQAFLDSCKGKKYDTLGALTCWMRLIPWIPESFQRLFCSEMVVGSLEDGGLVSKNASRTTPKDVLTLRDRNGKFIYDIAHSTRLDWATVDEEAA